jgi:hypothetical protein
MELAALFALVSGNRRADGGDGGVCVCFAVNQGLATLAFFGVNVNLVLFLTRVLGQSNGDAANNVSKWTGTVYMFSLIGAFLSDSYWGRYKTCAIFQAIFVLVSPATSTPLLLDYLSVPQVLVEQSINTR